LEPEYNERLKREAETLVRLQPHQNIVQCFERFEIAGLATLFLSSAGEETLGERLRQEGRLGLDLLQRFGEELISVVEYLEREGVPHRDIKPDNIGIRPGTGKRLTLTLFDFSLAGVPATDLNAGTRVYMDPFLRKRGMWDGYAERYSCALTLHEMATGTLPEWGDGSADPATLKTEIVLDSERFDASIRKQALDFFVRALARDHRKRFDNAEQMLRQWRKVFENVSRPVTSHTTKHHKATCPSEMSRRPSKAASRRAHLSARWNWILDTSNCSIGLATMNWPLQAIWPTCRAIGSTGTVALRWLWRVNCTKLLTDCGNSSAVARPRTSSPQTPPWPSCRWMRQPPCSCPRKATTHNSRLWRLGLA
jgi:serine/threonine protein kinase